MIHIYARRSIILSCLLLATAGRASGATHAPAGLAAEVSRDGAGAYQDTTRLHPAAPAVVVHLALPAGEPPDGFARGTALSLLRIAPLPEIMIPVELLQPPAVLGPPPHHLLRSTAALGVVGAASFGIIWALPEEISKWDKSSGPEGFRPRWSVFRQAYTSPPVWDEDDWPLNYVAHPLVGMHTYLMERNYGFSPTRSFLFSTAASVGWEYLIESWAEQPSIQDLLLTSTVGSLLGELNYQTTQRLRQGGLSQRDKVLLTILNPVHVLQHGYR